LNPKPSKQRGETASAALNIPSASRRSDKAGEKREKIGLALAGGGPLGAMYEIGVLMALDESLDGLDLNDLDIYVGVSAGSFIGAGLVNGLTPAEIFRLFIENKASSGRKDGPRALKPEVFLRPAYREYWRRAKMVPPLFAQALWTYISKKVRRPFKSAAWESFAPLTRALPAGIFDNDAIRRAIHLTFSEAGRTNDFRALKHKLIAVATRCAWERPALTTCRFRARCKHRLRCQACFHLWRLMGSTTSTGH
jgi:NTE family protein